MKNRNHATKAAAAFLVLCAAVEGNAVDLSPPAWRGQVGSAFQSWSFDLGSSTPAADAGSFNPYGVPGLSVNDHPILGTGWYDTLPSVYGSKQGFWDIGPWDQTNGAMVVTIPSSPFEQLIQIQVTYWLDISEPPELAFSSIAVSLGSTTTLVENPSGPGAWYTGVSLWQVPSDGMGETISFLGALNAGTLIDQIVIDTIPVVPEPSVLALGGIAALCAYGFLRRRRS